MLGGGRGRAGLQSRDPVQLVRPDDFVRARIPLPAANAREPLRFRQLRLLPAQRFFGPLALGDVHDRSDVAGQRAVRRQQRDAAIENPSILAVVPPEPVLECERLMRFERRVENLEAPRKVVRMNRLAPSVREHGLQRAAGERHPRRVDVGAAFVGVRHPNQDGGQLGDGTHTAPSRGASGIGSM